MSINRKMRRQQKRQTKTAQSAVAVSQYREVVTSLAALQRLRQDGRAGEAVGLARQLLGIEPANRHIHLALAGALHDAGQIEEAIAAYRRCIALAPREADAYAQLARCQIACGDLPDAVASCRAALKLAPQALGVHQIAGKAYERMARFAEAADHYRAVAAKTGHHGDLEVLGRALNMANDITGARQAFTKAIKAGAPRAKTKVMLARLETSRGNLDGALGELLGALRLDPLEGYAHLQLADDLAERIDIDRQITLARSALASGELPADRFNAFIPLHFALGRLVERKHDYERAFEHYRTANEAIVAEQPDDHDSVARQADRVRATFTAEHVAAQSRHGHRSEQPVFVFGLPRSGTTLVEQILASHSQAVGLGELEALDWMPTYLQASTPERVATAARCYLASYSPAAQAASRVIDKSISTYLHAGLALSLFPQARLINCRRHPLDIAHSLYRTYFGRNSVPFANSFARIATRMRLYEQMMEHWHRTFPDRILDVRYETLVTAVEETSQTMVCHIGLDWQPGCLDFHDNTTVVHTASLTQVRRPVYASAIGKWRRHEEQFAGLAQNIDDLITAYEANDPIRA